MFIQLGWRNIWRNPRRTVVILTAIVIGIWSMIYLGAFMRGMEVGMIQNGIATLTGSLQIHKTGYRDDPSIENSMPRMDTVLAALQKTLPPEARWAPRIRVNAIASNARHSTGVTLVGIDPPKEAAVSFIGDAVVQGRYLTPDDRRGVIVGRALLDKFDTKLGHKLVIMSQDTGQEIASKAFRIIGVFKAEMQATEKQYVFVNLPAAKKMLKLPQGLSEISIRLPDQKLDLGPVRRLRDTLGTRLGKGFQVHTWPELLPMLKAYLDLFDGFLYIWYVVVFIAMSFGIVNTTLMAVFERMREFGLLKALGMKPFWIIRMVMTESVFLLILGMLLGNGLALISILAMGGSGLDLSFFARGAEYWGISRIVYPALWLKDVLAANVVVLVLGLVVSLYPAAKAARFTAIEAMAQT